MNKYVLRTSLIWIAVLGVVVAALLYHARTGGHPAAAPGTQAPGSVAPAAVGTATANETAPATTAQAPLAPVQITPERMQSIGVTTGRVEFKPVDNDIRATGNVDIDQRLIAYVQVRFHGYLRQVFANAAYQYVRKGEPLFTIYSPDLV